ncbi:MAG: metal ABC transporter permease [Armatimonadota bacterium]|nr:MAG: metal ABC transporter permease [Armatimonadota bacterium]
MAFGAVVSLMLPAFCMCVLLVGIMSYLGIHVIKREIIFVDLALAQIAALGTLIALLLGIPLYTQASYVFAVVLTAIAAVIFTITRMRESKVPQEAVIGLVYAIAAATAILLIDKAPHGAEHVKDILTGSVLWVKWTTIRTAAIVFAAVGLFHYIFRRQFLLVAENAARAESAGVNVRVWDFLFYLSFGFVITMSVNTAGVLLVFVFLVAPAVMAMLVTDRLERQLLFGWLVGVAVTTAGLVVSYAADLPTGPMVIGMYAAALVIVAAVMYNVRAPDKTRALGATTAVAALFAAAFGVLFLAGKMLASPGADGGHARHAHAHNAVAAEKQRQPSAPHAEAADHNVADEAPPGAPKPPAAVRERSAPALKPPGLSEIEKAYEQSDDPQEKTDLVVRAIDKDERAGVALALRFLAGEPPAFFAQTVVNKLDEVAGLATGFEVTEPFAADVNQQAARRLKARYGLR